MVECEVPLSYHLSSQNLKRLDEDTLWLQAKKELLPTEPGGVAFAARLRYTSVLGSLQQIGLLADYVHKSMRLLAMEMKVLENKSVRLATQFSRVQHRVRTKEAGAADIHDIDDDSNNNTCTCTNNSKCDSPIHSRHGRIYGDIIPIIELTIERNRRQRHYQEPWHTLQDLPCRQGGGHVWNGMLMRLCERKTVSALVGAEVTTERRTVQAGGKSVVNQGIEVAHFQLGLRSSSAWEDSIVPAGTSISKDDLKHNLLPDDSFVEHEAVDNVGAACIEYIDHCALALETITRKPSHEQLRERNRKASLMARRRGQFHCCQRLVKMTTQAQLSVLRSEAEDLTVQGMLCFNMETVTSLTASQSRPSCMVILPGVAHTMASEVFPHKHQTNLFPLSLIYSRTNLHLSGEMYGVEAMEAAGLLWKLGGAVIYDVSRWRVQTKVKATVEVEQREGHRELERYLITTDIMRFVCAVEAATIIAGTTTTTTVESKEVVEIVGAQAKPTQSRSIDVRAASPAFPSLFDSADQNLRQSERSSANRSEIMAGQAATASEMEVTEIVLARPSSYSSASNRASSPSLSATAQIMVTNDAADAAAVKDSRGENVSFPCKPKPEASLSVLLGLGPESLRNKSTSQLVTSVTITDSATSSVYSGYDKSRALDIDEVDKEEEKLSPHKNGREDAEKGRANVEVVRRVEERSIASNLGKANEENVVQLKVVRLCGQVASRSRSNGKTGTIGEAVATVEVMMNRTAAIPTTKLSFLPLPPPLPPKRVSVTGSYIGNFARGHSNRTNSNPLSITSTAHVPQ